MLSIRDHTITDNQISVNNGKATLLGASNIYVGVATDQQVIRNDPESGLNYLGTEVVPTPIYDLYKQKHSCYFLLDLETGGRGWYPGAAEVAYSNSAQTPIYDRADATATLLVSVTPDDLIVILDLIYGVSGSIFYKVQYKSYTGYLPSAYITQTYFIDEDLVNG